MTRLVVGDTGPINYLLLIGHIDVLPVLFEIIVIPDAVRTELGDPKAPPTVRDWIATPPTWIEVRSPARRFQDEALSGLGAGEADAITLASELHADLLIMDDRRGVAVAEARGLNVAGTLGVLIRASRRNLLDLAEAFARLKRTNFHCTEELYAQLLAEDNTGRNR